MLYLVTQRTEKGMEAARQSAINAVYGTRKQAHFNPKIWNRIFKVTSETFEQPEPIRAWFKKNRDKFCGGNSSDWDSWLNGEDSATETLIQDELYRVWFMDSEEFNTLDAEQRRQLGI